MTESEYIYFSKLILPAVFSTEELFPLCHSSKKNSSHSSLSSVPPRPDDHTSEIVRGMPLLSVPPTAWAQAVLSCTDVILAFGAAFSVVYINSRSSLYKANREIYRKRTTVTVMSKALPGSKCLHNTLQALCTARVLSLHSRSSTMVLRAARPWMSLLPSLGPLLVSASFYLFSPCNCSSHPHTIKVPFYCLPCCNEKWS